MTTLEPQEIEEQIEALNLRDTFFSRTRTINAASSDPNDSILCCDHASFSYYTNFDTLKIVSVVGSLHVKKYRKRYPTTLINISNYLLLFDDERAVAWIPDKIEVLLSDYSHSPDKPIEWPRGWPDNNSGDTRKSEYVTSIYLDQKYFGQLNNLIKKRREKQAFLINGKKYFVGYRFPVPGLY